MALTISYDENLIAHMKAKFDLREPNVEGLTRLIQRLEKGDYDPQEQLVLDLATGVGKTYIMAAFVEYLRHQGVMNVMIVTPNKVVQNKTVADFTMGSNRYIGGFDVAPSLVTPDDVQTLRLNDSWRELFTGSGSSTVYIFNVQQLFPPKEDGKNEANGVEAQRRKTWRFQEETGVLAERLIALDDLVVIVDEAHLFGSTAKRFQESLKAFEPAATIGLTASASQDDDVVFRYPLWKAIQNGYVKQPVLVYRESGYDSEERQLQDAVSLLKLKEEAYANYRRVNPEGRPTRPLLFVVCADVNHATETATTLRNTYFSGDNDTHAVLQVDNQHDDATTQTLLLNLDQQGSPVRVIVSVNKLREGWDTKRIAVMCTLRAMGSEVLTQQVMGRGLRLPFGKITGVAALDELDIISHKSFVSLLKSEDVLREFGIEEKTAEKPDPKMVIAQPGTKHKAGVMVSPDDPDSSSIPTGNDGADVHVLPDGGTHPQDSSATPGSIEFPLGSRGMEDNEAITAKAETYEPVVVSVNEEFEETTFLFPSSVMSETQRPFSLVDIPNIAVIDAAKAVIDSDEHLHRTKIVSDEDGTALKGEGQQRTAVPSFRQSTDSVKRELIKRVMETRFFQANAENDAVLRRSIVPLFMDNSGIEQWTEKAKQSAIHHLITLVTAASKEAALSNTSVEVMVTPVELPVQTSYPLPVDQTVESLLDVTSTSTKKEAGFVTKQYYGPWTKGLFDAASFDSFSAEYQLANLLNFDPEVVWWTRIYDGHGAQVAYTTRNNYVPDFVVLDKQGTHWIVEGKAEDQRSDETVAKKRQATERLLRSLIAHPKYQDQAWAYLISFESDIRQADSFADLIAMGGVERMLPN
ncbi:DEAD/DEAH box helicase [Corynebacterium cystitidis]|uniref:DEAD/DEAH box helicase n=1 Tax=Corynebacterium cystitidis TaxID=35757 RepID=UPI00211EB739|nr:DEAD/DEAH box helicase family protein [Corynebacterium cystitidis]